MAARKTTAAKAAPAKAATTRKRSPRKATTRTAPPQPEVVEQHEPNGSTPIPNGNGTRTTHAKTSAPKGGLSPKAGVPCPDCHGTIGSHHEPDCAYKKRSDAYNGDLKERLARVDAAAEKAREANGKVTQADRERRAAERQQRQAVTNGKRPAYHAVAPADPNADALVCVKCGAPIEPSGKRTGSGWKHSAGRWNDDWAALRSE